MRANKLPLIVCVLLGACGGNAGGPGRDAGSAAATALSESECRAVLGRFGDLAQQEAAKNFPGYDVQIVRAEPPKEDEVRQCTSGKSFNRHDYACFMAAKDTNAVTHCFEEAAKHF